ncbi:MAG: methyltransferase domain-containing protein, partial [Candidatus Bipolaricaulia bacterium]
MPEPARYDEQRYLAAKRAIDARSRDARVWARFRDELEERARAKPSDKPLRILELGGGLGHLATEVMAQLDASALDYTLVDLSPANLEGARATVDAWALERGMTVEHGTADLHLKSEMAAWHVGFARREALAYLADSPTDAPWDVIIAQAFLDLVNLPAFLDRLFARLAPGALGYFPINFDGLTAFEPPVDPELD